MVRSYLPGSRTELSLTAAHDATPGEAAGTATREIGRFVTLGVLGRGGMGVVLSALDPRLDRKVAVKILHSESASDEARTQLQHEAMAMAKLAHPNVVTVYEVGTVAAQLFIAMELVDGVTLRAWLAQRDRGWREVLAMFVAAGRGLAAAHDAGLVHRDFKPENVLIGQDGRPRVSDFGLAVGQLDRAPGIAATTPIDRSVSYRGAPVGTPSCMAPEQWCGGEVDVRTDQFAFSVALWSAVYGAPPFPGTTSEDLRSAVLAGRCAPPRRRRRSPRWLLAILRRGLEIDPARRWPTLRAQLDEIERRAGARRRTSLATAGALLAAACSIVVIFARRGGGELCAAPDERIELVWGPTRKAAIKQHATAADPTYGAQRFAAVASVLDVQLSAWSRMHVATCRATRLDRTQSDRILDLRMQCLANWLDATSGVAAGLLAATTPAEVEDATVRVHAIPPMSRCADAKLLEAGVAPPAEPGDRLEFDAIVAEVKAIKAADRVGKHDGLLGRADAALARARRLGDPVALTRALAIRWRLAIPDQDIAGAVGFLREAIEIAARAHDDDEAAKSWAYLIMLVGVYQGHPAEARAMFPAARAAAARAGDSPGVAAQIFDEESAVLMEAGDHDAALAVLAEERAMLEHAGATQPGSPLARDLAKLFQAIGDVQQAAGQLDAAAASMRESLARYERADGPDTVAAGGIYVDLAQILLDKGELAEAEAAARASVRIRERGGQSPSLAMALSVLSTIVVGRGRVAEGVSLGERAVALGRATMAADDAVLQILISNLADAYDQGGRSKLALAMYDGVLETERRTEVTNANRVDAMLNRADIARRLDQCTSAIAGFHDAAQLALQIGGKNSYQIGRALRGEGLCLQRLGRHTEAVDRLERGLAYPMPGTVDDRAQIARGVLGTLLADSGRDRTRGRELVRAALARLRAVGSHDPVVPALEAWLAKPAKPGR